jgi:hypothetical protein
MNHCKVLFRKWRALFTENDFGTPKTRLTEPAKFSVILPPVVSELGSGANVHKIGHVGNLNGLYCGIPFANYGAIFTSHLESQLRPFLLNERHISVCWGMARDVLQQATLAAK